MIPLKVGGIEIIHSIVLTNCNSTTPGGSISVKYLDLPIRAFWKVRITKGMLKPLSDKKPYDRRKLYENYDSGVKESEYFIQLSRLRTLDERSHGS